MKSCVTRIGPLWSFAEQPLFTAPSPTGKMLQAQGRTSFCNRIHSCSGVFVPGHGAEREKIGWKYSKRSGKALTSEEKIKPKHFIASTVPFPTPKLPISVVSADKPSLQQPTSPEMVNVYSDTVCCRDCTPVELIADALTLS